MMVTVFTLAIVAITLAEAFRINKEISAEK